MDLVRKWCSAGDEQLETHEIESTDLLGHRVFHLQAGIHLQESGFACGIDDELDGSRVHVAHRPGGRNGRIRQASSKFGADSRGRCFFDDLLVPSLDRALSFE